jgi:hypothetical protein
LLAPQLWSGNTLAAPYRNTPLPPATPFANACNGPLSNPAEAKKFCVYE